MPPMKGPRLRRLLLRAALITHGWVRPFYNPSRGLMTPEKENHKRHGSRAGAVWILIVIAIALIIVAASYQGEHGSNNFKSQTTGFAVNARSTIGSGTSSTGGR